MISLSVIASRISRIYRLHCEAEQMDARFDGGEFSGPCHVDAMEREIDEALTEAGWTRETYNAELDARTSPRFAFFSGLYVESSNSIND